MMDSNKRVEYAVKKLATTLETVQKDMITMNSKPTSLQGLTSPEGTGNLRMRVIGLSDMVDEVISNRAFIENLRYYELEDRYDAVRDTHQGTVEWVLDDSKTGLYSWLRSKGGIFWIRGKVRSLISD
jgi:hypothetical protein